MDASKVRGRNEVRVSTKHPNEVEEMLDHLPQCVVTEYAQVWNREGLWMFWIRTETQEMASSLRHFLATIPMNDEDTQDQ